MTTIRINNATVVTLDAEGRVLEGADVVIIDGVILTVGEVPAGLVADEVVDASGRALLPGFVNAHCHSPMTFERGWAEDLPFKRWLNEKIWVAESALTPDDVYWGAALAACEMIRSGTVAFNDHYFYMDRVVEVVEQSGLKAALTWCVFGVGAEAEVGPGLEGTVEWLKGVHGAADGRLRTFIGPHSPYICPPDFLRRIVELAHETGQGIHIHLAEDEDQVKQSMDRHGMTPVQQVDALGLFDVPGGTVAAHCLAIDRTDTAILAEKGVHVVHCPVTYMKLAMPFPALDERIRAGVKVSMGTDGPGSNSDMDMFAVIRQAALMEKYQSLNPELLPGDTPLRMASANGAAALGFDGMGQIAPGKRADLILVNLDVPHMRPQHSLIANLVHSAKGSDVTDVMVEGRWLMRNRDLLTLDEDRILYEADKHAREMVGRGMTQMREYKG